jgi:predicted permease
MDDLKFACRQLLKHPGFTAVVVLSLALGIGANATVLCWLRHLVLRPLPGVDRQEDLVVFVSSRGGGGVSVPDLQDLLALTNLVAGGVASQTTPASLTVEQHTEWVEGQVVGANFFDVLGVQPLLGRTFAADEDRKVGGNPVLVISERLWRRRLNADPAAIGRVVHLNRHAFTIIGVVPAPFRGSWSAMTYDVWAPLAMVREVRNQDLSTTQRDNRGWHNLARLHPGISLAQVQAAVDAIDARATEAYPATNREVRHRVVPFPDCPYGAQSVLRPVLHLLFAVSAGVLLLVGANVANLLLARAVSRRHEIAIRMATGASRARVVRQLLTESLVLAALGGLAGLALAAFAVDRLGFFLTSVPANVVLDYPLDGVTVGLTLAVALGTGLAFGLLPAWQAVRPALWTTLNEGGRSRSGSPGTHRLRNALVVVEVALAAALVVGAALCLQGLARARQIDVGFVPDRVLLGQLRIGMNGYDETTGRAFYRALQDRLAGLPGVESAALASWFPLGGGGCKGWAVEVEGYARPVGEDTVYEYALVSPRYFATLQVPLVAGRDFTGQDDDRAPDVAIVNEAFAHRFWGGREPLGQRFRCGGRWRRVVGVARTGRYNRLDEPASCFFYLPYQQGVPDLDLEVCLRTTGDPAAFASTLRTAVRELDPGVDLLQVKPMAEHMEAVLFTQHLAAGLLVLLGGVALILATLGVYAVMAYAASQRTQEFGIRLAMGAQRGDVLRLVLYHGLGLAGAGVAAGLALALAAGRLLTSFLHGVAPFDPLTFTAVALGLGTVALIACYVPARRAARVDPIVALRCE